MQCPQCQADNREGRRFCAECGAPLALLCPSCGFANEPGEKFCGGCGLLLTPASQTPESRFSSPQSYTPRHLAKKILTSRTAIEGERKQVTVLFCDIVNSTALAERLGPEAMHTLLNQFFELALAEVHHYEGTINQFLGDGFMALFGAPIAHEDHAKRAVLAALGMQQALRQHKEGISASLQIRIGLNTGLVVVGAIGDNLRMDYTAVGDTTNLAARLQQVADPGQVVISETTQRLVAGYCHTRPLGKLSLKGKSVPIQTWEVISPREARTRLEIEAERGLTPFVGRERELRILQECFDQVRAGHGQIVSIVGDPGIGKSRLLLEFRRRLGDEATWVEGHSMSFGRSIAFHPLIDLLKRNFRIEEGDAENITIEKIEQGIMGLGEDLRPLLPYLRYLLAIDPGDPAVRTMDSRLRRTEIFDALRRLILRAAEIHPQVIVFEDLHWMDQATETFLGFLTDSLPTSRVLCLLTYRPGYPPPFGERTYHTRLALHTLSTQDSVQMAQALLATAHLPAELQTLIVQKAEGNPFFVEEVVKSLREGGTIRQVGEQYVLARPLDEIVIPDTIQDVIMARIDRLEETPKKILQLAAVIGREFTYHLLDRITNTQDPIGMYLQELKALELIYEKHLFPELAYTFKHILTQEVAYNSLLVQRRKELHRLIGQAIEELYAERLAEYYEVLAHHFVKGEEWAKALTYLLKVAEKTAQTFASREAIALYDQALEVTDYLGEAVDCQILMKIHQAKMTLYSVLSDFERSYAAGERLLTLARQEKDPVTEATALAQLGWVSQRAHDLDRALFYARQAIEVGKNTGAKSVIAAGHFITGFAHAAAAQLDQAMAQVNQTLIVSQSINDPLHQSLALYLTGFLKNWEGNYPEAAHLQSEGLRIAREYNLLLPILHSFFGYGITLTGKGDYEEALAVFEEGLIFSEKVGDDIYRYRLLNSLGWLHIELGNLDHALNLNRQGVEEMQKRKVPDVIAHSELNLGDIYLAKGDLTLAQESLDRVYRLVNDPATSNWMKWRYSMHLFASLGELWLARGNPAKVREFAGRCLEIATRTNSRKYLVKGYRLQGEIALTRRQWEEAEALLQQALTIAQSIGNPTQLWKTHLAIGRLHTEARRREKAQQAYQAVCAVIDRVKASLQHPELRASLENSPLIRQIYDLSKSN